MNSITVYCGSRVGLDPRFERAAQDLGKTLAKRGIHLVYGGGNIGLMGVLADAVLDNDGQVTGVMPRQLVDREMAHPGLTRMEVVETMAVRKTRMEELGEGFIALPGGMGTFEELTEVFTRQQLGTMRSPIALYDVNGFWQPFVEMIRHSVDSGFIDTKYLEALVVESSPEEILSGFEHWVEPENKWG